MGKAAAAAPPRPVGLTSYEQGEKNMIVFERESLRISLITSRLLRTEVGELCDLPTQTVQNRDFGDVPHKMCETEKHIEITTDDVFFRVRKSDGKVVYAAFEIGRAHV